MIRELPPVALIDRVFNNVFVRGELFDTGERTEDGNPVYAEAWKIIAENDYGERLLHTMTDFWDMKDYDGPDVEGEWMPRLVHDPEGVKRAERYAKKIQDNIDAGGSIDRDRWYDIDPRYGSPAYRDFGTEDSLIAWERDQEHQAH